MHVDPVSLLSGVSDEIVTGPVKYIGRANPPRPTMRQANRQNGTSAKPVANKTSSGVYSRVRGGRPGFKYFADDAARQ